MVGLEHAPYLTPLFRWKGLVTWLFSTRLDSSVRYIALRTWIVCASTSVALSRSNSWSLLTLSNAFLMSIRHICVSSFLTVCIFVISSRVKICSVQFLPLRKPAYSSDRIWCFSRCCVIYRFSILSRILAQKFIRDIGLWFWGLSSPSLPLGMSHMYALLSLCGMFAVSHILWIMFTVIS